MRDSYEVLGLHPGASQAEVKDAYDKLIQVYNDQLQNDANMRRFVQEKRAEIEEAYQFLMGSSSQTGYDDHHVNYSSDGRTYYDVGGQRASNQQENGWQTEKGNPYASPFGGRNTDYRQQPYRSASPFVPNGACGPCSNSFCCQLCATQICLDCCCDSACGC